MLALTFITITIIQAFDRVTITVIYLVLFRLFSFETSIILLFDVCEIHTVARHTNYIVVK